VQSVPLRRRAAIAMIAAAALATVTGCAATSPAIITDPYLSADGTDAQLTLEDGTVIELTNFLVVLGKKGQSGQVVGAVSYSGTGSGTVTIAARDAAQVPAPSPAATAPADGGAASGAPSVEVPVVGGRLAQVGPEGTPFVLPAVNVDPGQYVTLTASSPVTGSVTWQVPVLAPNHQYAGLTGTAAAKPTATPTATPTETPAETPTDDAGAATTTEAVETTSP
jgi:hypothetical protein